MTSRIWQRLILAVAAAASIATSQAPAQWNAGATGEIDPIVLDAQRTKATYSIITDVAGPGPYPDLYGILEAQIKLRNVGSLIGSVQLRITLRSTTNPALETIEYVTVPTAWEQRADLPLFSHCSTPPCEESFEMTVELIDTAMAPSIEIGGLVYSSSFGDDYSQEHKTQMAIDVSPVP